MLLPLIDTIDGRSLTNSPHQSHESLFPNYNHHYPHYKKQKHNNITHQAPLYHSTHEYTQRVRNSNSNQVINATPLNLAPPSLTPSQPTLVKLTNSGKVNIILKNIQTGMMIKVEKMGELFKIIMAAKWDNFVFYKGRNYYVHLISEFYVNMKVYQREDGVYYVESYVQGINLKVDSNSIHKAMRLGSHTLQKPCINIFDKFVFD